MGILEIILIGISLSMDAFAVAVCKGLCMKKVNKVQCLVIALFFGGFQGLMPAIGWFLGTRFEKYITKVDHWIAFGLLLIIGGKMVIDVFKEKDSEDELPKEMDPKLDIKELFILAIATSIDALAVGITFAFFEDVKIYVAAPIIALTTFLISGGGVFVGNIFGTKYEKKAQFVGGVVLILLGVKILLEGLGLLILPI